MSDAIDPIDLKILEILEKDARANLNKIASECMLSSSAVLSRMNKLKKNGIIIGFGLIVKQGTLGYPYEATVGITTETPKTQVIVEEIRQQPNVIVCTKTIGRFNMCCFVVAKNMGELDRVTQKIKNVVGVKNVSVNMILKHHEKFENIVNEVAEKDSALDQVDLTIVKELFANSRVPFLKIGKKLQLSHETVKKRFEKLKTNGTILCCPTIIDYSKLGYQGSVFIFISLIRGSNKAETISELRKHPLINRIDSVMGAYDIVAHTRFKSLRDFTKQIDEIQQIPSVEQADMCLANFTYIAYTPTPRAPFECDTVELS
jgi:Lrp/AsnC family transcriptional regulator, leucine-responsive regulatory protein